MEADLWAGRFAFLNDKTETIVFSMFLLAFAVHTTTYPILLLPFLILIHLQCGPSKPTQADPKLKGVRGRIFMILGWFALWWIALFGICETVAGGMGWKTRVWFDL